MSDDEPRYRLVAEKRGASKRHGTLVRLKDHYADLAETPPGFTEFEGTYAEVAERAKTLNEGQERNSFLDYLYSPDRVGAKPTPPRDE